MRFSKGLRPAILAALIILSSCSGLKSQPASPEAMPRVKIRGILTEQDNYQRWVVFLTAKNFQSPFYQVRPNGRFLIEMLKVEPGNYRMHFGVKSKINSDYSSLVIPVYRPEINVGIIPTK